MKQYKKWFVFVVTFILVLVVFFICNCILAGLVSVVCLLIWGSATAISVFKWIVFTLIILQAILTFPFALKAVDKE